MERSTTLIACAALSTVLGAQPVIDFSTLPPPFGYHYRTAPSVALPPLDTGANVLWDLSQLVPTSESIALVAPELMGGFEVPEATVMSLPPGLITHYYHRASSEGYDLVAEWRLGGGAYELFYSDPLRYMVFPCTYGTSWSDSYTNDYMNVYPYEHGGPVSFEADGYGTLITPYYNMDDVLKVRSVEIRDDTLNGDAYHWVFPVDRFWKQGIPWCLAEVRTTQSSVNGGPTTTFSSANLLEPVSVGVDPIPGNGIMAGQPWPNPATGSIIIPTSSLAPEQVTMTNATGAVVYRATVSATSNQVDLAGLPAGAYAVRVTGRREAPRAYRIIVL